MHQNTLIKEMYEQNLPDHREVKTYIIVKNMKSYALYMPARIFQRYIGKRI